MGRPNPTFMGGSEDRVQFLKETEEVEKLRSRIGRECCPRKERKVYTAESGLVCHKLKRGENENNPLNLGVGRLWRPGEE